MVTFESFLHPSNADVPMVFTFFPIVTVVSFVHPAKAELPMLVMFASIVTFVTFLLPFNAFDAIAVTLNVLPPYFTVFGIVKFLLVLVVPVNFTVASPVTSYLFLLTVIFVPFFTLIVNCLVTVPV